MTEFAPDRATYIRTHWIMAAVAMAAGMAILWAAGNPHVWTGAIGGLAAVALRGWYLMGEELGHRWHLTDTALKGPADRIVPFDQIAKLRTIGAAVQVVTKSGDKHLIKFQADPKATIARIEAARPRGHA
ncbi:hypothetical protein [Mameliella sediminis]|uniref:hypothetical protein n=1 Tax=Mameliella sediminis TaxID=2836866 RepID=UPI001C49579E|nr:hypothetical protein [Mameliella sediminis]MBV7394732.1 hypothetical protein [Mameliella sediminis]MBY6113434.1 hypothetical protein [Antarctobacter heliothermus]MBY6143218.1 hypothetical protein [Mameliella alba]MCA0953058.1 hypothetical protein [Mameliella alba]